MISGCEEGELLVWFLIIQFVDKIWSRLMALSSLIIIELRAMLHNLQFLFTHKHTIEENRRSCERNPTLISQDCPSL